MTGLAFEQLQQIHQASLLAPAHSTPNPPHMGKLGQEKLGLVFLCSGGCCGFYIQSSGIIVDGCTSLQSEGVYCESI